MESRVLVEENLLTMGVIFSEGNGWGTRIRT